MTDGSLLMLVSLLTAPYSWIYDDGLAIPALLRGAYLTRLASCSHTCLCKYFDRGGTPLWNQVNLILLFMDNAAWLAWYLCAIRFKKSETENIGGSGVISE